MTINEETTKTKRSLKWRVVDIVVASVIGVASGVIFIAWNAASGPVTAPLQAALPGLQALGNGVWLFAGVLTAIIIRKPGAALFGETVAAVVSVLAGGGQWGITVLASGLVQGLGAELVFLAFLYANWRVYTVVLAGAGAGISGALYDLSFWYAGADAAFGFVYLISSIVSGAILAGLMSWLMARGLAATGVLNRFASGRERTVRV